MSKIINRTISFVAIIAIALFVGQRFVQQPKIQNAQSPFNTFLNKEEDRVWKSFERYGVTKELFEEKKQALRINQKKDIIRQQIHPQIKTLFTRIAKDFDLEPNKIAVKRVKEGVCEAWVDNLTMVINEPAFLKIPQNSQRFILAHELQHIIFNDHQDRYTLGDLIDAKASNEVADDLLNQFYRFQEIRADVLAALKNDEYAKGYECCMKNYLEKGGDSTNPSHPRMSDRVKLAHQIVLSYNQKEKFV